MIADPPVVTTSTAEPNPDNTINAERQAAEAKQKAAAEAKREAAAEAKRDAAAEAKREAAAEAKREAAADAKRDAAADAKREAAAEAKREAAAEAKREAAAEAKREAAAEAQREAQEESAEDYANCDALTGDYPHGVGRPGATDRTSDGSDPVTAFKKSSALYEANSESDRDNDGIACERH